MFERMIRYLRGPARQPLRESREDWPGWLDINSFDRDKAIDEILKRADFPVRDFVRVTHMVRAFRTPTDIFNQKFREHLRQRPAEPINRNREERARQRRVERQLIRDGLAPLSDDRGISPDEFKQVVSLATAAARQRPHRDQEKAAITQIDRLHALFTEKDGALNAKRPRPGEDSGRDTVLPLQPYPPGTAHRKRWYNFWRKPGEPTERQYNRKSDLRLLWEGYATNQNFTVWEDFDRGAHQKAGFIEQAGSDVTLQTGRVALDSFEEMIEAHLPKDNPFVWHGDLLAISHFWMMPIENALPNLSAEDKDRLPRLLREAAGGPPEGPIKDTLKAITDFARATFHQRDQTRSEGMRDDLVISHLAGGAAILIADFRPHSRDEDRVERAARALILNIAMPPDQSGRMLQRCIDIATYRNLALKEHFYLFPIKDHINQVNRHLYEAETELSQTATTPTVTWFGKSSPGTLLQNTILRLVDLSARLSAAHYFFTGGLNAHVEQARTFAARIEDRIADLREDTIGGYQSLSSYLRRFESAIEEAETVRAGYSRVRDRIDELSNLARAELDQHTAQLNRMRAIGVLVISLLLLAMSSLAVRNAIGAHRPFADWPAGTVFEITGFLMLGSLIGAAATGLVWLFRTWAAFDKKKTRRH